jgi:hypothetical protein
MTARQGDPDGGYTDLPIKRVKAKLTPFGVSIACIRIWPSYSLGISLLQAVALREYTIVCTRRP